MGLKHEIEEWDCKSKQAITTIYQKHCETTDFLSVLIKLLSNEDTERGASWLLKHHFDCKGTALSDALEAGIWSSLSSLTHWEAKLHVLQIIPHLSIPSIQENAMEGFLMMGINDRKTLVRAWSYFGLALLAKRFPTKHHKIEALLKERAETETGGSVRVRIRKAKALMNAAEVA
ncbi:hypothetical protein [Pseudovibrio brasiliensis]|uniref:HEAT repeat domain-containing protein n=1 Tax=Pseudovibrio brasiliensis TaxID=1898042 RepID=A0ABX8AR41_9HYPH|nr:hypothetical protein [Pseudovibrio brasiliensis]QUS56136.1 hypothetical protein KGB56_01270 [Pseudovibrio brasiliensis]